MYAPVLDGYLIFEIIVASVFSCLLSKMELALARMSKPLHLANFLYDR